MREPFMDAFEAALNGDPVSLKPWLEDGERPQAGLWVYRNTTAKARADALAALYPTVERLVGPDWFREAALVFALEQRPDHPVMDAFGAGFPDWLETFQPARTMRYLPPMARLDAAWSAAHRAADAPVVEAAAIAGAPSARLFAARVSLHPSARLFWFDWTAPSIWLSNRPEAPAGQDVEWIDRPEGLMILRPEMTVVHRRLSRTEWAFLDACGRGRTLGEAANAAFRVDPTTALPTLFAGLLASGVFSTLDMDLKR